MEPKEGLERTLQGLVDQMRQERRHDGTLHISPDPNTDAEQIDVSPSDFEKGKSGGSP